MFYIFVSPPASFRGSGFLHPQQPGGLLRLCGERARRLHLRSLVAEEDDELLPAVPFGGARRCERQRRGARPSGGGLRAGQEKLQHGGHLRGGDGESAAPPVAAWTPLSG